MVESVRKWASSHFQIHVDRQNNTAVLEGGNNIEQNYGSLSPLGFCSDDVAEHVCRGKKEKIRLL